MATTENTILSRRARAVSAGRQSRSISKLYNDFEKAHAAMNAVPPVKAGDDTKVFDRAASKCFRIARDIVKAPAQSLSDMLLKIHIAGFCTGTMRYKKLPDLDNWDASFNGKELGGNEELHCLVSLRNDIRGFRFLGWWRDFADQHRSQHH